MPLQKITLRPGVNRENTRYTNEGGWFESNLVRFRQGTPEKIGGWVRISANYFLGVCRSLWNWATLGGQDLLGVGTNIKFYIETQGLYYDITPISDTNVLTDPFSTVAGSSTVTVTDTANITSTGSFVTFSGATAVGGLLLNGEYRVTGLITGGYTITASGDATSNATGGGTVYAVYQLNIGLSAGTLVSGWGSGTWGSGVWGTSAQSVSPMRIWNQNNFGQNLLYGPRGGPLFYWDASIGYAPISVSVGVASPCVVNSTLNLPDTSAIAFETTGTLPTGLVPGITYYTRAITGTSFNVSATPTGPLITTTGTQSGTHSISPRGVALTALAGASDMPLSQTYFLVSDVSRFVICFGTNDTGSTVFDPMLIRWGDQESLTVWTPAITNQAGSQRLSHGSKIITAMQSRQEIVVWTDSSFYGLQYLGPPYVWGTTLLADNTSIAGPNAAAVASGVIYWMGVDKFYKYDGRVQTLNCDLQKFIYDNINRDQFDQIYANTNEGFNEVWFFYCTEGATFNNRYVVYNYLENCWYYGSLARPAWLDTGLRTYPLAATYDPIAGTGNIVNHEYGVDDGSGATLVPMESFITSAQFDIGDGHNFAFVWRMLPDLTFLGSTDGTTPSMTIQLLPLQNAGSGYNVPKSIGGTDAEATQAVTATQVYPITAEGLDRFNGQLNIRLRGRQMAMRLYASQLGTQWQMGTPRIDIRPDGRRGG